MSLEPIDDAAAREMRRAWFRFVEDAQPHRADLHRYCLRLTGDPWDAEDLVQDTLLRGYGAMGRGDLHGESSRMRSLRAYLFRIASNLWIDQFRRASRRATLKAPPPASVAAPDANAHLRDAARTLLRDVAPQERAAIVLKEAFDFTNEEIAEMLSTTTGAVKSALHRGRGKLQAVRTADPPHDGAPSPELLDRFVNAFNARDVAAMTALLLSTVTVHVPGVGGGRGELQIWVEKSIEYPPDRVEWREYRGERIAVLLDRDGDGELLCDVVRLEEVDGRIGRITDYCYCPDTLRLLAEEWGLGLRTMGYHQPPEVLEDMIASSGSPWL